MPARPFWLAIVVTLGLFGIPPAVLATQRWDGVAATIFAHVAQDAELPNSAFPQALAQDRDGFIWVATENGLARWDGYRFRIYKPNPDDSGSLPDNVINALHTDIHGTLWIGTDSRGLARYDPVRDRFVRAGSSAGTRTASAVFSIADDGWGGVVVGTDRGLEDVDDGDAALAGRVSRRPSFARALPGRDVHALLRDRSGTLWIGTTRGLLRWPTAATRVFPVAFAGVSTTAVDVRKLFEDQDGRIWIGTQTNGSFTIEPHRSAPRPIAAGALGTKSITALVEPRAGTVWIGTGDGGILAVDARTKRFRRIVHDPNTPTSLPSNTIVDMLRDRAGRTWVATLRSISFCDARQTAITTVFGPSSLSGRLSSDNVRSVLPTADGRIWIGFGRDGADLLDPGAGTRIHVRLAGTSNTAKLSGARAIATGSDGDVIFGGFEGMSRLRGGARVPASGTTLPRYGVSFPVRTVRFVNGRLWFSGFERGLWSLDDTGHAAIVRDPRSGAPLTDDRVMLIEPGPRSSLWLGTPHGLLRFDPRVGIIERIGADPTDPAELTSGLVTTVLTDRRGRLWVGTDGGGIDVLVSRDRHGRPAFRRLGTAAGLPNDSIDKLLADRRGTIWASTDAGIVAIDPATFAIRTFGAADGAGITGYWVNAGAASARDELYFGGLGGMTVVRPDALAPRLFDAPIVATEIRLGGKVIASPSRATPPLVIPPDANSLSVEFAALDLSASERYRYAYRLSGYDAGWTEVDAAHRFAAYTNLPPGSYRLSVRAADPSGIWDVASLQLDFTVLPAWNQTPAFRLLVAVAALITVIFVTRVRTAYLRRRQRELEREVAARTAELRETQAQLEKIAYLDTLTALPNRRMFNEHFARLVAAASRGEESFGLVLLDLDGFKIINDTFGHDAGDAILVAVAERLHSAVRASDIVARLGGDEFALLLCGRTTPDDVESVCRRVIAEFVEPVYRESISIATGASLGAAFCPRDGRTQETLYKCADLALYAAKRSGRNAWRWYDSALQATLHVS
jgi:diguanylate cyclase (GGDEF)-like protein